jgi:hypothetical protein
MLNTFLGMLTKHCLDFATGILSVISSGLLAYQRVLGSSPGGGAIIEKPSKIDGFFFIYKVLTRLQLVQKSVLFNPETKI